MLCQSGWKETRERHPTHTYTHTTLALGLPPTAPRLCGPLAFERVPSGHMQGCRSAKSLLHMAGNSNVMLQPRVLRQAPLHQSAGEGCTACGHQGTCACMASAAVRHAQPLPGATQPKKWRPEYFWGYVECTCSRHTQKETHSCICFLSNDSGSHGAFSTTDRCRPQQPGSCAACPPPLATIVFHT